jgi:superfamily II DNA or RNA helicase
MSGYQFMPSYKNGSFDGFVYNFKPANIRAGFLQETIEHLNKFQIPWQWENNEVPEFLPFYREDEFDLKEFSEFCQKYIEVLKPRYKEKYGRELEVRPYQIESCFKCLTHKTGIILHATGSGKSFTIALVLAFLFFKQMVTKAAIVVPRQSLTTQFRDDLIDFGFDEKSVGVVLAGQKQTNRPITIIMNQSIRSMENSLVGDDFLSNTDFVVCDEVHTAAAETVTNGILKFVNSKYFLGFTGTLPENELDCDTVNSLFGYVLDEQKVKDLAGDVLAYVTVGFLTFNYGKKSVESRKKRSESTSGWLEEVAFLQNDDEFRNAYINNILVNKFQQGTNIIVLVKNIEYGKKMFELFKSKISEDEKQFVYYIDGSVHLSERDRIIQKSKDEKHFVIFTNFKIFSTGISINSINLVAMIDAGKSKITVAQTIGRGMRKDNNKNSVAILDCSCDLKYGAKHGRKRKLLYEKEGFRVVEKIVSIEDDELKNKISNLREASE